MDLLCERVRRAGSVEDHDALRVALSELAIPRVDAAVEFLVLALEPVVLRAYAVGYGARVEQEKERAVGHEPADRREVEVEHPLEPEAPSNSLVRDGRVDVAVADDRLAPLERRADDLLDVLRASRRVQQRLRPGLDVAAVQDQIADLLAELGTSRLAGRQDRLAVGFEARPQELCLRRFAAAVEPFEGDEHRLHPMAVVLTHAIRRMRPMRAVVTDGAGFIGSHVVDALVARGDDVSVVDSLATGKRENVSEGATLHVRDIREPLDELFDEIRPEAVFHLAAQVDIRVSVEYPVEDAEVNVIGTVRVLEAARRHGAQVVFSSTGGAIYGECVEPAGEDSPLRPLSPYGTSKLGAEEYLRMCNRLYETKHVCLRFGNVYGPRQDPHGEAGVVAIFLGALRDGKQAQIFGEGTQSRDYVYVGDVARATVSAIGQDGGVFNVGTGRETSVVELYELCRRAAGSDVEAVRAPARLGELQRSFLDPTRAAAELGFMAMVGLEDGLQATWEWVGAQKD